MTTRRERREQELRKRRREQRKHGSTGGGSGSRAGTYIAIAVIAIVLIGGGFLLRQVGAFDPPPAPIDLNAQKFQTDSTPIGTKYPDESNGHVPDGTAITYATNPPTSGPHYGTPAPWGIKDLTLPDGTTTHNLEHGGIVIQYNQLSPDDLSQLKTLARALMGGQYRKIILEPYPKLTDAKIAVSAWTWQVKLAAYDEATIVKFIKAHYQGPDAPEPNAA